MIDIALFGPTLVWVDGRKFTGDDLGGVKPRQILEMLALAPGRPLPKDVIAERLWEGRPPTSWVATLESYVCGLRRRLGLVGGRHGALATQNKGYVLDPDQVRIDHHIARRMLVTGGPVDVATTVELAADRLLDSDPYAGWADRERRAFTEEVATACLRVGPAADAAGHSALAVQLAATAVAHDQFSEAARQLLMRSLWHAGERSAAVLTYVDLRERMQNELGVEPGAASQALYVAILRDELADHGRGEEALDLGLLLALLKDALERGGATDHPGHANMLELGRMLVDAAAAQASRSIGAVSRSVPVRRTHAAPLTSAAS